LRADVPLPRNRVKCRYVVRQCSNEILMLRRTGSSDPAESVA
jgi:hypothetical protein